MMVCPSYYSSRYLQEFLCQCFLSSVCLCDSMQLACLLVTWRCAPACERTPESHLLGLCLSLAQA